MATFDEATLAQLTQVWLHSLDDVATVLRAPQGTATVSPTGGRTTTPQSATWGTVTRVPARWQPVTAAFGERALAGGPIWAYDAMTIQVPAGTDVQPADRVRKESDATLWEVRGTSAPRSNEFGQSVRAVQVTA